MNGAVTSTRLPETAAGWQAYFSGYADIVLVANSDAVDIDRLTESFGHRTLFVFFNKTYKVLGRPFDRPALLVARSSPAGANIVYRREVAKVVAPFTQASFAGILNLRVSDRERFSEKDEFEGRAVGFLDLSETCDGFYPPQQMPTSGFALAVWLAEQRIAGLGIHLAGFTARRSARWKLFRDHDWTFEQTGLKLLHRAGLLALVGQETGPTALQRFTRRFPEVSADEVAGVAFEVLGERLSHAEGAVDQLIATTRVQAKLRDFLKALKPETRKAKLLRAGRSDDDASNALAKSPGSD